MNTTTRLLLCLLCLITMQVCGQNTTPQRKDSIAFNIKKQDPFFSKKHFFETSWGIGATRINNNYTVFNNTDGLYQFKKNTFTPTSNITIDFGWLWHDKDNDISMLKTGISASFRSGYVSIPGGGNKQYSEGLLYVPLMFSFREPLRWHTIHNDVYRALDWGAGIYAASVLDERLANKSDYFASGKYSAFTNMRMGVISEFAYSETHKNGKGWRIGLRAEGDIPSLAFGKTAYNLHPYYFSTCLFYSTTISFKK